LAASVPILHECILERQRRQRVAEESQVQSLRHQLEDARAALAALERIGDRTADEADRLARLETTLTTLGHQLSDFDTRVNASARAVTTLEDKANKIEHKTHEDVQSTTKVVEAVQADLSSRIKSAEGRFETSMKRLESLEAASREDRDLAAMRRELLAPIVQISGEDTVGSGVLLYSDKDPDAKQATLVVSSYHVVRNILAESALPRDRGIKIFFYPDGSPVEEAADMLAYDEGIDLVLLRLRGDHKYPDVAKLIAPADVPHVTVFTPIYAVGCPLGNDPVPTSGEISSLRNNVASHNYWMINAPTYFGNSGGGVFLTKTRELIGVFSKIYTHGSGRPTVIPHMGLATPALAVADFLDKNGYGYVVKSATARRVEAAASRPAEKPLTEKH
jgi:S1-C subfamily serine protease